MQTLHLIAGTPEWHAHRAQHFNASDAPAMLGCSPYTTRAELLRRLHTGLAEEVDAATERRFADGHRFEALARPLAEEIIGDDLAPVVGTAGKLSASFDGLTLMGDTAFEHKTLNDDLRACMKDQGNGYDLPKHYRVQMEQQLLVSGADRVLFMASKWNGDTLEEERHCWYACDPDLRTEIIAGWKQFEEDLETYQPPAAAAVVVAAPVQALPAVTVQVSGEIAVRENFHAFEVALRDFLEHRLIREPKTDQDFADLDVQIKAMKGAEAALDAAEGQMLAQIQTVDQAKKTKDMLAKLVRDNRLMAEKLLKDEKERRRGEIVAGGVKALADHIAALNARLGKPYMPIIPADFGGCIKGMKSLASMEEKVATELARAKSVATEIASKVQENLTALRDLAKDHAFLFADTASLVLKSPEDCRAQITSRIAAHKAEQERKLEAERERIRAEEAARLEREQAAREAEARRQQEAAARAEQQAMAPAPTPAPAPAAESVVIPIRPTPAPAANAAPTLKLGEINARLAPLQLTADGLAALGFPVAKQEGAAKLWHENAFAGICDAVIAHAARAKLKQAA